ncbi:hypothetical protein ANN_23360 [Periplaneta americana]|uniref:Uncharacterized protein n=1 Tax=Periplaneta americana TaxID=6978 RepID=A0ABQ8SKV9_PERAM|nr:hypothetical protein ANN_23360 [Periplaneta americana]
MKKKKKRRKKCTRFAADMALLAEEMILRDMLLKLNYSCDQCRMKCISLLTRVDEGEQEEFNKYKVYTRCARGVRRVQGVYEEYKGYTRNTKGIRGIQRIYEEYKGYTGSQWGYEESMGIRGVQRVYEENRGINGPNTGLNLISDTNKASFVRQLSQEIMGEPTNHGNNAKNKKDILYPNIRPVPHGPDIPVPLPPESDTLPSGSRSTETESPVDHIYEPGNTGDDRCFNQSELNDLARDLNLPKESAELLGSRLKEKKVLAQVSSKYVYPSPTHFTRVIRVPHFADRSQDCDPFSSCTSLRRATLCMMYICGELCLVLGPGTRPRRLKVIVK